MKYRVIDIDNIKSGYEDTPNYTDYVPDAENVDIEEYTKDILKNPLVLIRLVNSRWIYINFLRHIKCTETEMTNELTTYLGADSTKPLFKIH